MISRAPLDVDLAVLLEEASRRPAVGLHEPVEVQRADWRATSAWMRGTVEAGLGKIPSRNAVLGGVHVRWYGPEPDAGTDVIVYVHGGGWMFGEVDAYDPDLRFLQRCTGRAVVAIDYRRTPEHPFPAALEDCATVVQAVATIPHRGLALAGDSAGGHIALATALELRGTTAIDAVLALYPVVDPDALGNASHHENGAGYLLTSEAMAFFWAHYASSPIDSLDPRFNLAVADFADFPATVVASADYDPLRDEARSLAGRLAEAEVDVTYLPHPGLTHGFQQMVPRVPAAVSATSQIYAALLTTLHRAVERRARASLHRARVLHDA